MTFKCQRRGPKQNPPGRLSGDFRIHKLEKIFGGGEGKRKCPARQCKVCATHKKWSETGNIWNSALFRFIKGLVLRNTIQWQTTRLSTCSFCSLGLRSIIYSVKPWVRICYVVEHSKHLKRPVTRGYLIKRPPWRHCVKCSQDEMKAHKTR